jgi:hypothetical protein
MNILLILFLLVDAMAAFYLYRQAFVVRSNMNRKYKRRFTMMMVVIIGSLAVRPFHLILASVISGLPAVLIVLFGIAMAVALISHKGPWH